MAKPDFLDDVVSEAGPPDDKYGASMSSDDDEMDSSDDSEEAKQDRIMAAKSVMKAVTSGDANRLADALAAFVKSC